MYKILIRNRELDETDEDIAKYSFYLKDEKDEFETSDISEALETMNNLLDSYLRKDILLVDKIITTTEVIYNKIETIEIIEDYIGIINDGTDFKFYLDLSSLGKYTIVNINSTVFNAIKSYLESLGLTDVNVESDFSITAKNPTGIPVIGILDVVKGLYVLYSRETNTSNYITSQFSTTLVSKIPGEDPEPIEDDDKFIDIYFVDEDNNSIAVDMAKLFYRGGDTTRYDYEYHNVEEIHTVVKNSGNYLLVIEKENYDYEPYYEKIFTGKSRDEDVLRITLTKKIDPIPGD